MPPINHAGILVLSIEAFVANKFDVFVTGGTGYMGSRLISTLVERGKAPNDSALSHSTRWYGRFGDEAVDESVQ